jgi:hypothetical protein
MLNGMDDGLVDLDRFIADRSARLDRPAPRPACARRHRPSPSARTAERVAERLHAAGLGVRGGLGGTGVVGLLEGRAAGPTIGLRADMDALPMHEANDFAHRSQPQRPHARLRRRRPHRDAAGAAKLLARGRATSTARVHFIFQPAEEGGGGAPHDARRPVRSKLPVSTRCSPSATRRASPLGGFAHDTGRATWLPPTSWTSGPYAVVPRRAHSMPHQTRTGWSAAAAALVQALRTVVSRRHRPAATPRWSIGRLAGRRGLQRDPESVTVGGTVRTLDNDARHAAGADHPGRRGHQRRRMARALSSITGATTGHRQPRCRGRRFRRPGGRRAGRRVAGPPRHGPVDGRGLRLRAALERPGAYL